MKYKWEISNSENYPATLYVPNNWDSFKNIKNEHIEQGRFKVIIGTQYDYENKTIVGYYYWIVMLSGQLSIFSKETNKSKNIKYYDSLEEAIEQAERRIELLFGCGRDLLNNL